jgi:hypothetical protein
MARKTKYQPEEKEEHISLLREQYKRFQELLSQEKYYAAARRLFDNTPLVNMATRHELETVCFGMLVKRIHEMREL